MNEKNKKDSELHNLDKDKNVNDETVEVTDSKSKNEEDKKNDDIDIKTKDQKEEEKNDEQYDENTNDSMFPMVVGAIILALGIIFATWFFITNDESADLELESLQENTLNLIDNGDPDDVVAVVNGQDLTRAEMNRIKQQLLSDAQRQGMDLNNPEVASMLNERSIETLVNTELIRQKAIADGVSVTEEEVDERFNQIIEQVGGEDVLESSLTELGITMESLRSDVQQELLIEKFLSNNIQTGDLVATPDEVEDFYEMIGGEDAGLGNIEELRPQIEQQVIVGKENDLVNELLATLREDAEIEIAEIEILE